MRMNKTKQKVKHENEQDKTKVKHENEQDKTKVKHEHEQDVIMIYFIFVLSCSFSL